MHSSAYLKTASRTHAWVRLAPAYHFKDKQVTLKRKVFSLDFALLNPALVQVLNELLTLHPVDERAHIAAVAKKSSTCQVHHTPCRDEHSVSEYWSALHPSHTWKNLKQHANKILYVFHFHSISISLIHTHMCRSESCDRWSVLYLHMFL